MMPGRFPLEELTSALLRVASNRSMGIEDELRRDSRGLARAVTRHLPESSSLLLIVDQFEELFTLTSDDAERSAFLSLLTSAVEDERSRLRIVLTMRADFFDRPLRFGEFGELLRSATVPIAAPTAEAMQMMVEQPAGNEGVRFEPGLVERIVSDVVDQPGSLPLLEFSLTELFDQRTSDLLTRSDYVESGGVLGALGRRAESIHRQLDDAGQTTARQVFLRLVSVDESGRDTRRRVRQAELQRIGIDAEQVDSVVAVFADHRLLTIDRDPITRGPTVELAHEAILSEWQTLQSWVDDRREDLLLHRRLSAAVRDFEASGDDDAYLLGAGGLAQHLSWTAESDLNLTSQEREFLDASAALDTRVRAARRRRTQWVLAGFAMAALIASVLAVTSLRNARQADNNASLAKARELGASAVGILAVDPELSTLLNLEAFAATPDGADHPTEVINALWTAVQEDRLVAVVETGFGDGVFVALSPDETTLFVVNGFPRTGFPDDLAVQAYATHNLELLWEHRGQPADLEQWQTTGVLEGDLYYDRIHVSPDGERVSLGLTGAVERFLVLDAADGSTIDLIESHGCGDDLQTIPWGWSPDGTKFVVTGNCVRDDVDGPTWVEILDGETFAPVALIDRSGENLPWASFDDAGRMYLFGADDGLTVHEPDNYSDFTSFEAIRGRGDVTSTGSLVATFDPATGDMTSYDAVTGGRVDRLTGHSASPNSHGVAFGFSGAGDIFATPTGGAHTVVWDVATGRQLFNLPSGPGVNAALSSDGLRLYTAHLEGTFKVWDLAPPAVGLEPAGGLGSEVVVANTIVAGNSVGAVDTTSRASSEQRVRFFDLTTGRPVGNPVDGRLVNFASSPIRPLAGNRFLITGLETEQLMWFVYDPITAQRTQIAGCELDPASNLCLDGAEPAFYLWVVSDDGTELLRQGDGALTLIDPSNGESIGQLNAEFVDTRAISSRTKEPDFVIRLADLVPRPAAPSRSTIFLRWSRHPRRQRLWRLRRQPSRSSQSSEMPVHRPGSSSPGSPNRLLLRR